MYDFILIVKAGEGFDYHRQQAAVPRPKKVKGLQRRQLEFDDWCPIITILLGEIKNPYSYSRISVLLNDYINIHDMTEPQK